MVDASHEESLGLPALRFACRHHLPMAITGPRALWKAIHPEMNAQPLQSGSEERCLWPISLVEGSLHLLVNLNDELNVV